jgi:hypothetical protein
MNLHEAEARIDTLVNALKQDGQNLWAEQLRGIEREPVESGTQLAMMWRKCLLQILQVPSLSDSARNMANELVNAFDEGLGYSRLPRNKYPDDHNRSRS